MMKDRGMIETVTASLVQEAIAVLARSLSVVVVFSLVWRLWPVFVEVVRILVERVLASLAKRLGMETRRPASTTGRCADAPCRERDPFSHSRPLPWSDQALAGCLLTPVLFRASAGDPFFGLDRLAALLLAWVLANLACNLVNASESRFCPSTPCENGSPAPQTVERVIDRLGVLAAVSATAAFVLNQPARLVLT
jgi:hypothetical protein